ncbi:PTS sugar transporter subunit IIB [Caviibacter abscessus]|uniref:PTS sugar transporter subunit IIB n=1 Tax=Caviibacter abscessus TaxID=1766719 RepID=UPI0008372BEF|nr:PTS sugar transporter subunit IIB [Caviibacter abscessus]
MKVLFVCSAGMSSTIAINALKTEATKKGYDIEVVAVGTQAFEEELKKGYDLAMVAPQIRHRYDYLQEIAKDLNVPIALIEPQAYSPLGGLKLLNQVLALIK